MCNARGDTRGKRGVSSGISVDVKRHTIVRRVDVHGLTISFVFFISTTSSCHGAH